MRVTEKELRMIIREERARLLRETVIDMMDFEDLIQRVSREVSDMFGEKMKQLPSEDMGMAGMTTAQVDEYDETLHNMQLELDSGIANAIAEMVMEKEDEIKEMAIQMARGPMS